MKVTDRLPASAGPFVQTVDWLHDILPGIQKTVIYFWIMPGQVFLDIQLSSRRDSGFSQAFS
ncbi:MAG: hypothetical protein EBS83_10160, partial [Planctomycetia bacterium]|nr:hypothetical protein [Planctomycetia bacterium]